MSSAAEVEHVSSLLYSLENKTKRRLGTSALVARQSLARQLQCAPGTLTDILKRRVKGVDGWLRDRIEDALVRSIKSEIGRLQDEELAIRSGSPRRAREVDLAEIEEDLARLKNALRGGAEQ